MPQLLFLRPFWDARTTAEQVRTIYLATKDLAHLVVIRNGTERTHLRLRGDENAWLRYGTAVAKLCDWASPPLDLTLMSASDENWQAIVVEQIRIADAIIINLAPRKHPDFKDFTDISPNREPQDRLNFAHNPVHEAGTGRGLLRELEYCQRVGALGKVVALIPYEFYPRVQLAMRLAQLPPGAADTFLLRDRHLIAEIPRLSALDQSISALADVNALIIYQKLHGWRFKTCLRNVVRQCLRSSSPSSGTNEPIPTSSLFGIPSEPIQLPPDNEPKRIRFTPIETLTNIPLGKIVEVSLDEVGKMHPDVVDPSYKCPGCGGNAENIFWFQYGLEADTSIGEVVFQKCQYCGHRDYILGPDYFRDQDASDRPAS